MMAEYRSTHSHGGNKYAKLVGGEWVDISEDEAKSAGVWRDPRGGQYGVKDQLATPEQLSARHQGLYDPRPASGSEVAVRVNLHCCRCNALLGKYVEFEKRCLFYSVRAERWTRQPSDLKCLLCFEKLEPFEVDLDAIGNAADTARSKGRPKTLKIGKATRRDSNGRNEP